MWLADPVIPLDEAIDHVLRRMPTQPEAHVHLAEALGLVATRDVRSDEEVPGWDNTAVDGYAVRSGDVAAAGVELAVVGTVAAGEAGEMRCSPGTAVKIMTGAPLPEGADAVVMVERTAELGDGARVRIDDVVEPGAGIRRAGEDVTRGDVVVAAGTVLGVGHLGLLASVGVTSIAVRRRVVVGVMSTGDELVDDGSPLRRGQVRDSNRISLLAACREAGFVGVDLGLVADDPVLIESTIRSAVGRCDAVLTSGGVSMGEFDHVRSVLALIGDMRWMQIAIKPAKPFAFGLVEGTPVFGLPGNPVSSLVSFELLARPALLRTAGRTRILRRRVRAVAQHDLPRRSDGKTHFVRVALEQDQALALSVRSAGGQGSHIMTGFAGADGLAVLVDGQGVTAGDSVDVILLDG